VGASYGLFASELDFDDGSEPGISEQLVVAALGRRIGDDYSVRLAAGAVLGGSLTVEQMRHEVGTGFLLSVSVARRWLFGGRFFGTLSLSAGASSTTTRMAGAAESVRLTAGDIRVGGMVGLTLWQRVSPYVLARGFGGPVLWQLAGQDITGTDQHHYQLGAGMSLALPFGFNALVDASLVGERSLSVGASFSL
jgi:hypothetical protein